MNFYKEEPKTREGSAPAPKKKNGLAGKGKFIQRVLSGDFLAKEGLVQHMPFIAFLVVLFLLNIGLVYYFENTAREKVRMQNELNETRALYNTTMSRLETSKRQSNVAQSIRDMGLKELRTPPQIIDVEPGFFDKKN
ncbi:MAG TPA: FtsL-like putative cell division protein [Flavobacteriales bacterium]